MLTAKKPQSLSYYDGGDAVDLLRRQHREIDQLWGAVIAASSRDDKQRLLAEAGDLLAVHMAVEERVFYPGLTPERGEGDSRSFVVLTVEDHFSIKGHLSELLQMDVEERGFDAAVERLRADLRAHNGAEERLFPRIRRRLPSARLRRLEYEMRVLEFQIRTDAEPRRLVVDDDSAAAFT